MRNACFILGLVLLVYLLLFHRLGEREMWSSHEARAAQDAQSIVEGGDWRLPRLMDGRAELQKPPLYYWLTALVGWWRGEVDEVAVRLPAAGGAVLAAAAVLVLLHRLGRARAGWIAAVMLLTMVHFTWLGRVGRIDMPLTAAVAWSIVAFVLGMVGSRRWWVVGYLCLACGLMLKGPIAVVLVGVVVGVVALLGARGWFIHRCDGVPPTLTLPRKGGGDRTVGGDQRGGGDRIGGDLTALLRSLWWGVPLVAVLVAPWCWWVNEVTDGGFVREFVIKHNVQRGLGGDEQLDAHVHPWWFYLARLWVDTAPWSVLLPFAGWWWLRRNPVSGAAKISEAVGCHSLRVLTLAMPTSQRSMVSRSTGKPWHPKRSPESVGAPDLLRNGVPGLGLVWFVAMLGCLSLFQYKRADYLLPAYPGLAVWLGVAVDGWLRGLRPCVATWCWRGGVAIVGAVAVGWLAYTTWVLPGLEPGRALGPFARVVREHLPRPGQVILFRVDSHHLNWELGRTVERIWEWENLGWWATRPAAVYVVMPRKFAKECAAQLPAGRLIPLASTGEHEMPLVLLVNDVVSARR